MIEPRSPDRVVTLVVRDAALASQNATWSLMKSGVIDTFAGCWSRGSNSVACGAIRTLHQPVEYTRRRVAGLTLPSTTAFHTSFHSGRRSASSANFSRMSQPVLAASSPSFCAAALRFISCNLLAASRSGGAAGCIDAPVVVVVVAGDGAPRCLGVYGTYRGPGAAAPASGVSTVAAVEGDVDGEGEIAGAGERRG